MNLSCNIIGKRKPISFGFKKFSDKLSYAALEMSNFQIFTVTSLSVIGLCCVLALSRISKKLEIESISRRYTRELQNTFTAGNATRESFIAAIREEDNNKRLGKVDNHEAYITSLISNNIRETNAFARELAQTIVSISRDHNLDPLLVTAVIKAESTFKHSSISSRGALGLMQVKPTTGAYITQLAESLEWHGAKELNNPSYNIKVGVTYLRYLLKKFNNNMEKALIAYNWGPGNLEKALKAGANVPESTKIYARKILGNQTRWKGELKQYAKVTKKSVPSLA